jgi:hypothetical protein
MVPDNSIIVPTRMALLGIVLGVVSAFLIMQMQPGPSLAAVVANPPFTVGKALDNNLLKVDGDYYDVANTPGVSLTPESTEIVRKIGYGQTSFVNVLHTSSGTYSTDGLTSPYIRYPGIFTEREHVVVLPYAGIFGWSRLGGWVRIPLMNAQSISFLDSDLVPHSQNGVCVADTENGGCR